MKRTALISVPILFSYLLIAQKPIQLANPSFEGPAGCCQPPPAWNDCGFLDETPPDVQPSGIFDVNRPSLDGRTYLGMVVRDNDTWESVGQRLGSPLEAGACYEFSLYLCRSPRYLSPTKANQNINVPYTNPVVLRIWAGSSKCDKREMIAESPLIENTNWKQYNFKFKPKSTHTYFILEAFYKTPILFPYNGNVLVDKATIIAPVDCNEPDKPAIVDIPAMKDIEEEEVTQVRINQKPPVSKPTPKEEPEIASTEKPIEKAQEAPPSIPKPFVPKIHKELSRSDIRAGETIRLRNLYFDANDTIIAQESYPALDELYDFMIANPNYVVEIGGHTNGRPAADFCFKLSTSRARAVASYLAEKGLGWKRLRYKGYGKTKLIASDNTAYGRQKNQRVEIKILSTTG